MQDVATAAATTVVGPITANMLVTHRTISIELTQEDLERVISKRQTRLATQADDALKQANNALDRAASGSAAIV